MHDAGVTARESASRLPAPVHWRKAFALMRSDPRVRRIGAFRDDREPLSVFHSCFN
jgi:hypothetical protein